MWTLPGAMLLLGSFDIPIAMLVMPAFAGRLLWRLARETTQQAVDDGARGDVEEAAGMTSVCVAGLAAQ